MNANQDTIESHESARAFVKTTRQTTVQPHKLMKIPLMKISLAMIGSPTTKPVALREKDKIITIDGSQESTFDEMVARMSALVDRADSEDDSKADEHGDASIRPIAKMPAQRNENDSKDNECSDDCDGDRGTSRYDEYHYDEYCCDNDRYDDDRYDNDRYNYDCYGDDDEFLYGGFTPQKITELS